MNSEIDVRHVLASVNVPTLVLHSKGDRLCPIGAGRYMAERVPEAQFVELPGDDHYIWFGGDADRFADEVERFLTGTFNPREPDRALVTILFVDIVDSTRKAAELGDRTWRDLVDSFYAVVRNELERTRGRLIDTAGDGVFAAFDGPARAIQAGLEIAERVQRFGLTVRVRMPLGLTACRWKRGHHFWTRGSLRALGAKTSSRRPVPQNSQIDAAAIPPMNGPRDSHQPLSLGRSCSPG